MLEKGTFVVALGGCVGAPGEEVRRRPMICLVLRPRAWLFGDFPNYTMLRWPKPSTSPGFTKQVQGSYFRPWKEAMSTHQLARTCLVKKEPEDNVH